MRTLDRKPGKFTQTTFDPMMTQEKFDELKNKLERLKKISQPKAASEVSRLAELGDFSENTEYQMAKWKLRGINNSILTIDNQLQQAIIIPSNQQSDTVCIGHRVTLQDGDKKKTYQILGSSETSPQKGIISHNSPIGSAILGHRVGDVVEIKLANKDVKYKIMKIE
jgi:transcription elongation factor GreA